MADDTPLGRKLVWIYSSVKEHTKDTCKTSLYPLDGRQERDAKKAADNLECLWRITYRAFFDGVSEAFIDVAKRTPFDDPRQDAIFMALEALCTSGKIKYPGTGSQVGVGLPRLYQRLDQTWARTSTALDSEQNANIEI